MAVARSNDSSPGGRGLTGGAEMNRSYTKSRKELKQEKFVYALEITTRATPPTAFEDSGRGTWDLFTTSAQLGSPGLEPAAG